MEIFPLQIAGQTLLQEVKPLIVMHSTGSTPKTLQLVEGKILISNLQDVLNESNKETINNLAVCGCKIEIIANGKVCMISKHWFH